jgi:hypothetical protein
MSSVDVLEDVAARFVEGAFPVHVAAKTVTRIVRITAPMIARDFIKPPQPSENCV